MSTTPVHDMLAAKARLKPLDFSPGEVWDALAIAERQIAGKQAVIDRLMLEYCPEEMSDEQTAEWGKHQKPVTDSVPSETRQKLCEDCGCESDCIELGCSKKFKNAAPQVPGSSASTGAEARVQSPMTIGEPLSQKTPTATPAEAASAVSAIEAPDGWNLVCSRCGNPSDSVGCGWPKRCPVGRGAA